MNIKIIHTLIKVSLILSLFVLGGCSGLPGLNKDPNARGFKKLKTDTPIDHNKLSYRNINVNFYDLNKMQIKDFENLNNGSQYNPNKNSAKYEDVYSYTYQYVMGKGDVVSIKMTDITDVDGSYTINPDGYITIPYVGELLLWDQSKTEARAYITEELERYYKRPEIIIEIEEYNSSFVYITGAVRAPQSMLLSETPVRLLDFVIRANTNPLSEEKLINNKIVLRRDGDVYKINMSKIAEGSYEKNNFFLKKQDVIYVERNKDGIFVFGELKKPGIFVPHAGLTLTELLSNAGITQLTANAKKVFVIRENLDKFLHVDVFKLDVRNPVSLITGRKFHLQSSDIVFVPPSKIVQWNRLISLLTPSTDLFKSYNPVIQSGVAATKTSGEHTY